MLKQTVSRDDHIYECFPDIAMTPDGVLVCMYRECMMHAPFPFSRLVVRRSLDGGRNWQDKTLLTECVAAAERVDKTRSWLPADALAGYEQSLDRIDEDWRIGASINCPRLICLTDGTLLLIVDFTLPANGPIRRTANKALRSTDSGQTWSDLQDLDLEHSGYQPALTELRDGRILLGLDIPDKGGAVCFSEDGGRHWGPAVFVPNSDAAFCDELSFVELDDGTLVGFGRNRVAEQARRPSAGVKVISRDGGATWSGPHETWLMGLTGRPKAGLLKSGEVCITYRCDMPNENLAMHVMTQDAARFEHLGDLIPRQPGPEDVPALLAQEKGEERPWYMTSYYPGRSFILDCDRSVHRDGGYSGWVQLPDGDILVVDYIHDDAPLAQIRSYLVSRSDYILFPPGDMPWLHPSWQPFRAMTYAMAERQFNRNREPAKS